MNAPELKPCPQCLSIVRFKEESNGFECLNCEMDLFYDYRDWKIWEEINRLKAENRRFREALKEIADMDYRGNRPEASGIAYRALSGGEK